MVYVNDFLIDCQIHGELHLYAEDTTALITGGNPDNIIIKQNRLFEEICGRCGLCILESLK